MSFRVQQTQFAAGHGGFHVGRIETGRRTFAWGFDCGTISAIAGFRPEIAESASRFGSDPRRLDVMFVSHFDEDHVKGLPDLSRAFDIECVVAPLLPAWERLAQVVMHPDPSDFTLRLAADPASVLGEIAPAVVLVQPGGEGMDPPPEEPVQAEGDETVIRPIFQDGAHTSSSTSATFKVTSVGEPIWILAPYVPATLHPGRKHFLRHLRAKWRRRSYESVEMTLAEPSLFLAECDTQDKRRVLREAYEQALVAAGLQTNANWTSLVMYSGPYGPRSRWRARWSGASQHRTADREASPWGRHPGWFHTGDACLGDAGVLSSTSGYYGSWLAQLGTVQAPHHGSGPSWTVELAQAAGTGGTVVVPGVPGGPPGRKWDLPAHALQADVAAAGCTLVQVTGDEGSRFSDTWRISSL